MDARATRQAKEALDLPGLCRSIAEASPLPMAAVEGARHILRYANPAFCGLVDKAEEELIGNAFCGIVPTGEKCLSLLDRVYRTGEAETHVGQGDATSDPFWSYVVWPVFGADGDRVGIIVQVTEATRFHQETVAMNEALMVGSVRQHERTEVAEGLLQAANWDLSQFAFAASHDLQEPLRMISSYSELLIRRYGNQFDANGSQYLGYVMEGAKRMRELLDDLLSYTQAGASGMEGAEFVDLNAVCDMATKNLQAAIAESGAVVNRGELPEIYGHAAHFLQLLQNLIGNAIKYRSERSPRIDISAEKLEGEWRFAVTDNGMGIDPEYHRKIFGMFKRLHGKTIPGTGIGLAICQRVVERYGGRIWVESEAGRGATFFFTLPMGRK